MQSETENSVNLPEKLFVLVRGHHGDADLKHLDVLKAQNPEGELVAFAFTKEPFLKTFIESVGLSSGTEEVASIEISTADFLEQLASANEAKVHIDPMQEGEHVLNYNGHGTLSRSHESTTRDVRKAQAPLPDLFLESLKDVAGSLPMVETIWQLESTAGDEDPRLLLAVKQSILPDHEEFDVAFMELGDRWCDTLPPGIAVDMVAAEFPEVTPHLANDSLVYQRTSSDECCGGKSNCIS